MSNGGPLPASLGREAPDPEGLGGIAFNRTAAFGFSPGFLWQWKRRGGQRGSGSRYSEVLRYSLFIHPGRVSELFVQNLPARCVNHRNRT